MSFIRRSRSITTERLSVVGCPLPTPELRRLVHFGAEIRLGIRARARRDDCGSADGRSHDIPNQRVDRSIQVTLGPGRLEIDYEVSLSELTLTQDLRALTGTLPGGDRSAWLALYAEVTGPLNAKGLAVTVDGQPVILSGQGYDLVVEEHPRYTFHFEAAIPRAGRACRFAIATSFRAREPAGWPCVGARGERHRRRSAGGCRADSGSAGLAVERRGRAPNQAGRCALREHEEARRRGRSRAERVRK